MLFSDLSFRYPPWRSFNRRQASAVEFKYIFLEDVNLVTESSLKKYV